MPCYDYRDHEPVPSAPEHLLCEACSILEDVGALNKASAELKAWYEKHEAKEKARVAYEAALKLSVRERRLLDIDLETLRKAAMK